MKLQEILQTITGYENLELYDNRAFIDLWSSWWKGKVDSFHTYTIYNGKRRVKAERQSLGMGKKVAEDWANFLINEKTDITLSDANTKKSIDTIFANNKFWRKANEGVEKTFALGMGAFVVSVENISTNDNGEVLKDGDIKITFCPAGKIRPITIKDGEVIECAFINVNTETVNISIHKINNDGNYVIYNATAKGKDEDNLTLDNDSVYAFDTGNSIPWFSIIKPNIANNIDIDSPLGISIFANAIDILKGIDLVYDSYSVEFKNGRKRTFISAEQVILDTKTGEVADVFDSNDLSFYYLPDSADGKPQIHTGSETLRVAEHSSALQNQLDLLSYACGFGTQHYRFTQGTITTATQVISENSELFRNKRKHEIIVEECLTSLVKCLLYVANTFTQYQVNVNSEITIKFDDSIIEDKQAEKTSDRLDLANGVISKAEYRAKWYNEDLETAQKNIDNIMSIVDDEPIDDTGI